MERKDQELSTIQDQIEEILCGKRPLSVADMNDNPSSVKKVKLETVNGEGSFLVADGYVQVYTDGACPKNGKDGASAGKDNIFLW